MRTVGEIYVIPVKAVKGGVIEPHRFPDFATHADEDAVECVNIVHHGCLQSRSKIKVIFLRGWLVNDLAVHVRQACMSPIGVH